MDKDKLRARILVKVKKMANYAYTDDVDSGEPFISIMGPISTIREQLNFPVNQIDWKIIKQLMLLLNANIVVIKNRGR